MKEESGSEKRQLKVEEKNESQEKLYIKFSNESTIIKGGINGKNNKRKSLCIRR